MLPSAAVFHRDSFGKNGMEVFVVDVPSFYQRFGGK
jgi:hypothetical protein